MHVVSHFDPHGDAFKILGLRFDCRLTMADAARDLGHEMRWKVRSIMRSHKYQSTSSMVQLYKSKVLSYDGYRTSAMYHASSTALDFVDKCQDGFLEGVGVDAVVALLVFNLAPLSTRRDMAMFGLIHRKMLIFSF